MNVFDVLLEYQVFPRMAKTQADFYNYLGEDMIDNTYDRFMIRLAEGRRRKIVESDDETVDEKKSTVWPDQWCSQMWNFSTCRLN